MAAEFAAKVAATLATPATSAPSLAPGGGSDGDIDLKQQLAAETDIAGQQVPVPQHPPGAPQHLSTDDSVKHHPSSSVIIQLAALLPQPALTQPSPESHEHDTAETVAAVTVAAPATVSVTSAPAPVSVTPAPAPVSVTSVAIVPSLPDSVAVSVTSALSPADEAGECEPTSAGVSVSVSVSDAVSEMSATGQFLLLLTASMSTTCKPTSTHRNMSANKLYFNERLR